MCYNRHLYSPIFQDTDSFCYHITTEDYYRELQPDAHLFDLSDYNYPNTSFLQSNANKKTIGFMKVCMV